MAMAKNTEETGGGEKRSRRCELCGSALREEEPAAVHCESDEARLCWGCDARVHGANFLVSRHVRALLCRRCFLPTPWRADGPRLSTTISICQNCSCRHERKPEEGENQIDAAEQREVAAYRNNEGADVDDDDTEEEEEEDSYDGIEEDDEDEEEEEGENQVVPWSSPAETATTTTTATSSSSSSGREEEDSSRFINETHNMFLKRMRELRDFTTRGHAEEEDDDVDEGEATSYMADFRQSKRAMTGRVFSFSGANDAQ